MFHKRERIRLTLFVRDGGCIVCVVERNADEALLGAVKPNMMTRNFVRCDGDDNVYHTAMDVKVAENER